MYREVPRGHSPGPWTTRPARGNKWRTGVCCVMRSHVAPVVGRMRSMASSSSSSSNSHAATGRCSPGRCGCRVPCAHLQERLELGDKPALAAQPCPGRQRVASVLALAAGLALGLGLVAQLPGGSDHLHLVRSASAVARGAGALLGLDVDNRDATVAVIAQDNHLLGGAGGPAAASAAASAAVARRQARASCAAGAGCGGCAPRGACAAQSAGFIVVVECQVYHLHHPWCRRAQLQHWQQLEKS